MCQVEEHEILLFAGRNDLNQSENIGTSNIFISVLFHIFMRIDWINPTNKLERTEKHKSQIVFAQMHIFSPAWAKNLHKFVHIYTNYV